MKSNIPLNGKIYIVDASGMQCPGPIMKISEIISEKNEGDIIEITATDPGFSNDVGVWCNTTGNTLLSLEDKNGKIIAKVQKGGKQEPFKGGPLPNDKTIIVFSSDFDRAIASFVIANGALSMGRKVTMFFTFWGLNVLRKKKSPKISKDFFSKMFGFMMPKGTTKLKLSKMNFFGAGTILMKHIMKKKNINSLEEFMESAKKSGARLVACQMSMDMMGIKKEELIDGVEIGGVAAYLGAAESADTNLFI